MKMEKTVPNITSDSGLDRWLSCDSRCFGDKGDVEDITEGQDQYYERSAITEIRMLTRLSHTSRHHIDCRI